MSPGALSGYPKISKLHKQVGSELRSAGRSLLVNFDRVLQFYLTTVVTRKTWVVYQLKWGTVTETRCNQDVEADHCGWAATGLLRIGREKSQELIGEWFGINSLIKSRNADIIPKGWGVEGFSWIATPAADHWFWIYQKIGPKTWKTRNCFCPAGP